MDPSLPIYNFYSDPEKITYFLNISVGTPPQNLQVVMDTGSGNLGIDGSKCEGCTGEGRYNVNMSTSATVWFCTNTSDCECQPTADCTCIEGDDVCSFDIEYADNSGWRAIIVTDVVSLIVATQNSPKVERDGNGRSNINFSSISNSSISGSGSNHYIYSSGSMMTFGVIEEQRNGSTFYRNDDGTMGFAYGSSLSVTGKNWFQEYVEQHGNISNQFSMCMGWSHGTLVLGGIDPDLYTTPLQYTPIYPTGYYSINLTSITVIVPSSTSPNLNMLNHTIPVVWSDDDSIGPIIDTGSTDIHFDEGTYAEITKTIEILCIQSGEKWVGICDYSSLHYNNWLEGCISISMEELAQWPSLVFTFERANIQSGRSSNGGNNTGDEYEDGGVNIVVSPFLYMNPLYGYNEDIPEYWCLNIETSPSTTNINLGDPFIRSSMILFDIENMMIGFASPNPKYCY